MHPSNYSRPGRRRKNSREKEFEVKSDDGRKPPKQGNNYVQNHLKRSSSGPSLVTSDQSYYSNYGTMIPNAERLLNTHHLNQRIEGEYEENSVRPKELHKLYQRCSNGELRKNKSAPSSDSERSRYRSGSWTGVNESDDDMEEISRQQPAPLIHPPTIQIDQNQSLDDSLESSVGYSIPERTSTYQNTYNSYTSEETIPHNNNFVSDEVVKRRLKFFFMNPIEKWYAKRRFPWKLIIQIVKIVICTCQLCMFASQRYTHVSYLWDTKVSFSHLFIKGWDSTREVVAYPPATGPLAIYKISEFYDFLDYTIETFSTIEKSAIGAYKYDISNGSIVMPNFCIMQYEHGALDYTNLSYVLNNKVINECFPIPPDAINGTKFSIKDYLKTQNLTINFDILLEASYSFTLKTMKLRSDFPFETPECYRLETLIYFDNNDHDGQMLVELDIGAEVLDCKGTVTLSSKTSYQHIIRSWLNILTICICATSLVMCLRALFRAQILKNAVNKCFKVRFHRYLNRWERFEFVNLWYVLICVNDSFIIIGSIIKMGLESQRYQIDSDTGDNSFDYEGYLDKWNVCSLLLGLGNLFIWFGCLRYLGFFETYNVLILTIKSCFPNVLRYSICILMVFAGYSFCGWLVLGPYHIKFRSLSTTTECLYSLINGDDMFATFSSTIGKDAIVWWFSRIYLYTFISLFIYVILSLFIAIITDAYDTIKRYYEEGFPASFLMEFANECQAEPFSGDFRDEERTVQDVINNICCCCRPRNLRYERRNSSAYEPIRSSV